MHMLVSGCLQQSSQLQLDPPPAEPAQVAAVPNVTNRMKSAIITFLICVLLFSPWVIPGGQLFWVCYPFDRIMVPNGSGLPESDLLSGALDGVSDAELFLVHVLGDADQAVLVAQHRTHALPVFVPSVAVNPFNVVHATNRITSLVQRQEARGWA